MKLTQFEASRSVGAKLKKDHVSGLRAGTPVGLEYRRSYLDRPRYLGGRLVHEFDATCRLPEALTHRIRVTDKELVDFAISGANSSFQRT